MLIPPRHESPRAGFSLVETALALGIVSFVLVAIFGLSASTLRHIRASEDESKLSSVLQRSMVQLRMELMDGDHFNAPPAPWTANARVLYFSAEGNLLPNQDGAHFQVKARLSGAPASLPNIPAGGLKTLTLKVGWPFLPDQPDTLPNLRTHSFFLRNPSLQ